MVAALLMTAIAGIVIWLVFFKFKWIRLTYAWGFFLLFFYVATGPGLSDWNAFCGALRDGRQGGPAHHPADAAARVGPKYNGRLKSAFFVANWDVIKTPT